MEHKLRDIAEFCKPELHEGQPYFRWYCWCGVVGGDRPSEEAARTDFERHRAEG